MLNPEENTLFLSVSGKGGIQQMLMLWVGLGWIGKGGYFVWYSLFASVWKLTLAPVLNSAFVLSTQSLESALLSKINQLCSMLEFNFFFLDTVCSLICITCQENSSFLSFWNHIIFLLPSLYRWIMIRIPIPQSRDILGKSIFALPVIGKTSHYRYSAQL